MTRVQSMFKNLRVLHNPYCFLKVLTVPETSGEADRLFRCFAGRGTEVPVPAVLLTYVFPSHLHILQLKFMPNERTNSAT